MVNSELETLKSKYNAVVKERDELKRLNFQFRNEANVHRHGENQLLQGIKDKDAEIAKLKEELDRHKDLLRVQCNRSQDLSDAMTKSLEHLEIFNFAKDPVRVAYADTIIRTALGGG